MHACMYACMYVHLRLSRLHQPATHSPTHSLTHLRMHPPTHLRMHPPTHAGAYVAAFGPFSQPLVAFFATLSDMMHILSVLGGLAIFALAWRDPLYSAPHMATSLILSRLQVCMCTWPPCTWACIHAAPHMTTSPRILWAADGLLARLPRHPLRGDAYCRGAISAPLLCLHGSLLSRLITEMGMSRLADGHDV